MAVVYSCFTYIHLLLHYQHTAFVYAGDIPCDAFFWNDFGVIGSMNGLYPIENLFGGLGRNFMSRCVVCASVRVSPIFVYASVKNMLVSYIF